MVYLISTTNAQSGIIEDRLTDPLTIRISWWSLSWLVLRWIDRETMLWTKGNARRNDSVSRGEVGQTPLKNYFHTNRRTMTRYVGNDGDDDSATSTYGNLIAHTLFYYWFFVVDDLMAFTWPPPHVGSILTASELIVVVYVPIFLPLYY